jgi:sec-independent protein translocase protein TatB
MSGVGFWELILLFLIGLIVLGPERLPRVANQLGSWLGQARRMTRVLKRQLEDELDLEKNLNIRPKAAPKTLAPKPFPEADNAYSPSPAADSPATGVPGPEPVDVDEFTDTDVLEGPPAGENKSKSKPDVDSATAATTSKP